MYFRTCPASFFFVLSSDAVFRFTFAHTAKLENSTFLNDFILSLTPFLNFLSFFWHQRSRDILKGLMISCRVVFRGNGMVINILMTPALEILIIFFQPFG